MLLTIHVMQCQTLVDHVVNCHNFISMAVHTFINLASFRITLWSTPMYAFPNRTYTHDYRYQNTIKKYYPPHSVYC